MTDASGTSHADGSTSTCNGSKVQCWRTGTIVTCGASSAAILMARTCIATKSDGCMPSGPASFSGSWWRVKKTGADSAPSGRSMPASQSSRAPAADVPPGPRRLDRDVGQSAVGEVVVAAADQLSRLVGVGREVRTVEGEGRAERFLPRRQGTMVGERSPVVERPRGGPPGEPGPVGPLGRGGARAWDGGTVSTRDRPSPGRHCRRTSRQRPRRQHRGPAARDETPTWADPRDRSTTRPRRADPSPKRGTATTSRADALAPAAEAPKMGIPEPALRHRAGFAVRSIHHEHPDATPRQRDTRHPRSHGRSADDRTRAAGEHPGRSPGSPDRAASVVGGQGPCLGLPGHARRRGPARRRASDPVVLTHDPQRAQPAAQLDARGQPAAPGAARAARERRRRALPCRSSWQPGCCGSPRCSSRSTTGSTRRR